MSWATCYSGSNNTHFNTPPIMSDGRHFTTTPYDTCCKENNKLRDSLGIKNNYQYRQWLINNGEFVIKSNNTAACDGCSPCVKEAAQAPFHQKYLFKSCQDNSRPYGYEGSDLKNLYFTRRALQSRLKAPIMTQEQLLLARASKCSMGDANSAGPMKSCSTNKFN
tara:strand:+ start:13 stop:507 length:495 start_codon:yes stop_codon:yes gene_type:complete